MIPQDRAASPPRAGEKRVKGARGHGGKDAIRKS
jgi:hypothetical protein